mgnify:CR=1 FL=1
MSRKRKALSLAESIHDELICPITYEMPAEPVYAEDGRLYERSAIEQWFAADNRSSPMTKLPMGTRLVDAVQVRNVIEKIVESGELPEERAREWRANREAKRAEEHARLLTGLSAQRRALKVDDALRYLDTVKEIFYRDSSVYNSFLDCMKQFKKQEVDTEGVIARVIELFEGHRDLISGFNVFLPPGYCIELPRRSGVPRVVVPPPISWDQIPAGGSRMERRLGSPVEFNEAISYVTKIKSRFERQPRTYERFLDVLHNYQQQGQSVADVYREVRGIFEGHPDLIEDFHVFLPPGAQVGRGLPPGRRVAA